ncbi:RELT-like protein 1 [Colossoma macropomum]|uniref:RELT-like protein 1 n=1 Tax=Colossoma macropomum TaxID=42526 RepID=UPI0018642132|nr:RELT-like protein 1 [Colossoma macropomum]
MADSSSNTTLGSGNLDTGTPGYIAFVIVLVFFLLGLLGVLICHVLKKKGYRCTTDAEEDDELEGEEEKHLEEEELNDTYSEGNTDTVGQIVHYIMKNEANTDALKAMVTENSIDSDGAPVTPTSPTTPVSPGAPPSAAKHTCNHLHTIGGIGGQKNICNRCNHKKWPLMRRGSNKKMDRRSHVGEVTVLSVGRFRVTKSDPRHPVRRTLLITEPNGSVPTSPAKAEAGPLSSNTPSQPQAEGAVKK